MMNDVTATGPWNTAAFATLRQLDPDWAGQCLKMSANPWTSGVLPRKTVELVAMAWCCACTNLNADGTRRHIRRALDAGASREEILMVLKMASLLAIHTCSLAAPILLDEARAAGVQTTQKKSEATPVCDKMKAAGQWNAAWELFFSLDPAWTEAFISAGAPVYIGNVFPPEAGGTSEHRLRRIDHSYGCAGYSPTHPGCLETRRDDGGDHGGSQDLPCRRDSSVQSRRANSGRRT